MIEYDRGEGKELLRLCRIEYYGEKSDKILVFINNIFYLMTEVAEIYESRWEIE
jgi:hypothetical protein